MPQRAYDLGWYDAIVDGIQYDSLKTPFHLEESEANEYVPLRERRPSVRYALCRAVVDDSVGLLFSEEHFPKPMSDDPKLVATLLEVAKETNLNEVMIEAATRGSVGSVCILMRVLKQRVFFKVMRTQFLTPVWQDDAPDTLASVIEKYKTTGRALKALGYAIDDDMLSESHWFQRVFDLNAECWFTPWPCSEDENFEPLADSQRSRTHALGFVPMVWIKNLPGGNDIDGACTFKLAIDTSIEIDYQLSQAGRALKYAADPTMMIKEPSGGTGGEMVKGGGNAIVVSEKGDAKLIETSGGATEAVIEYVRLARQCALESIHGNKADADKIAAAQSGRAMELMNQALIWLADKLRISYGENGLLCLLNMVMKASQKSPLKRKDETDFEVMKPTTPITLKWPEWYAPTYSDKTNEASALTSLTAGGILSKATATESIADQYDIADVPTELTQIEKEQQASQDAAVALAVATKPPVPDNSGD